MIRSVIAASLLMSIAGAANAAKISKDPRADQSPMSAVAVANLLSEVCEAAAADRNPAAKAAAIGLKRSDASDLSWALADDARVWTVATRDSDVMVYAYGPNASKCGVIVGRPLPGAVAERVSSDLTRHRGYAEIDGSTMPGNVAFVRFFSEATGRYVDMLEYPARANAPGVLKFELLAN